MKLKLNWILNLIFGGQRVVYFNGLRLLVFNYLNDFRLFYKHSALFKFDTFEKIECQIILDYHSIEKGFLFKQPKPKFAKVKVQRLHANLARSQAYKKSGMSQVKVSLQVMCKYYELHNSMSVDISDYFSKEQYCLYKEMLGGGYSSGFKGSINYLREDFYSENKGDFYEFSNSRKSVRSYTGEKVEVSLIKDAIALALNAPSVCNRQGSKVYLLEDKLQIDKVLQIQGGLKGYTESVAQLLILTENRNYFYTVGERNQLYIDGGIFLMNLLYSLHFYRIANCPANWGKNSKDEKKLEQVINIPCCEKIICMIPIGISTNELNVTLSKRRDVEEVIEIIT
jgi:nitroreductase